MTSDLWDWDYVLEILPDLLDGVRTTILATVIVTFTVAILGMILAVVLLLRIPVLSIIVRGVIDFVRGTPLLVQLFFLFFVLPETGIVLSPLATGMLGSTIYLGVYVAEVYRAGIENVPLGQWEACLVLGFTGKEAWRRIVVPQGIRTIIPSLGNYVILLFKETALYATIGVYELMGAAMTAGQLYFRYVEPVTLAGLFYLILSFGSSRLLLRIERKLELT